MRFSFWSQSRDGIIGAITRQVEKRDRASLCYGDGRGRNHSRRHLSDARRYDQIARLARVAADRVSTAAPLVFLTLVALLLVLLAGNNPKQALLVVAVVACGGPVYYLLFRKRLERA
jgi:hypothetical protein